MNSRDDPIMMPCEGSGYAPAGGGRWFPAICAMCGEPVQFIDGKAADHERDDVLARIERGDFDV